MDVHPPLEPIHTWRAFFLHLITITIGLLIALGLEGIVEWAHHRELVYQARSTIRQEIESNHRLLAQNVASIHSDEERITADIKLLLLIRSGKKIEHGSLAYTVSWSSFGDSGWKAAQSSGALSYMDFTTAQDLAGVYAQQDFVMSSALRIYRNQTLAIAPLFITNDPNQMSKEEAQVSLERSADLLLDVRALQQVMGELDREYTDELRKI